MFSWIQTTGLATSRPASTYRKAGAKVWGPMAASTQLLLESNGFSVTKGGKNGEAQEI
jgi:hypothetical protein